jgi:hypothetical protein
MKHQNKIWIRIQNLDWLAGRPIQILDEKYVKNSAAFHGGSSHFFGIGIYPVSDTAGIGIIRSVLLYCKLWREHLFKILRELYF